MSRLAHPHCVSVIDFGVEGSPYLVMDFVTGRTLRELMLAGRARAARASADRAAAAGGPRARARAGDRPPRSQAREPDPERRGGAGGAPAHPRLRPRQAARRTGDDGRDGGRHAELHVARAVGRGRARSTRAPISTPSASCCSRCSPAASRSSRRTSASSSSCSARRRRRCCARSRPRRDTPRSSRRCSARRCPSFRRIGSSRRASWPPRSPRRRRPGGRSPRRRAAARAVGVASPPRRAPAARVPAKTTVDTVSAVRRRLGAEAGRRAGGRRRPASRRTAWMVLGGFVLVVMLALSLGRGLRRKVGEPAEVARRVRRARRGFTRGRPPAARRRRQPTSRRRSAAAPAAEDPRLEQARQLIARRRRSPKAIALLDQLRAEEPANADVPYLLAMIYFDQRRWSEGLAAAQIAVRQESRRSRRTRDLIQGAIRSLVSDRGYERVAGVPAQPGRPGPAVHQGGGAPRSEPDGSPAGGGAPGAAVAGAASSASCERRRGRQAELDACSNGNSRRFLGTAKK